MTSFRDLDTWKKAHVLALLIYKLTNTFPKSDEFALVQQMQRASLSVASNIAEGFGRQTQKDTLHFYVMARGSLSELESQVQFSKDLSRISQQEYNEVISIVTDTRKVLTGLIKSTRNRNA